MHLNAQPAKSLDVHNADEARPYDRGADPGDRSWRRVAQCLIGGPNGFRLRGTLPSLKRLYGYYEWESVRGQLRTCLTS
jgi:hypothetical protein